jgi:hypothetical protein
MFWVLILVVCLARSAGAQKLPRLHWTQLSSDSNLTAWMDTTRITSEAGGLVGGWYKVRAAHESKFTVAHYAVDCVRFSLSARRIITYDGAGGMIDDQRQPTVFYSPPPLVGLQNFMHIVCHQPLIRDST